MSESDEPEVPAAMPTTHESSGVPGAAGNPGAGTRRSTVRRWLPWLAVAATLAGLVAAFGWWRGPGAEGWIREQDLARALSRRWGLQVEVRGLTVEREGARGLRARIERLTLRGADLGFSAQARQVTVRARGGSLDSLRIESLQAASGQLAVALDSAGRPRLPPAFARESGLVQLPRLDVAKLELSLTQSGGLALHAPDMTLRGEPAASGAAARVELRGPRAQLSWHGRQAELTQVELSFDGALDQPRARAALTTRLGGEVVRGQAFIADGRAAVELDLAGQVLRAPGSQTEVARLAGQARLSAALADWRWAGEARGTLRAPQLGALGELPWTAALQLNGDEVALGGTLQVAGAPWQLRARLAQDGLRSASLRAAAGPLGPVIAALGAALGSSLGATPGAEALRGELELHVDAVDGASRVRVRARVPRAVLGEVALEGLTLDYEHDGLADGGRLRLGSARLAWQGLEAREPRAELRLREARAPRVEPGPGSRASAPAWSGRVTLPELRFDGYLARATAAADLGGHAAGTIELASATSRDPAEWVATLTLSELRVTQASVEVKAVEPLLAELSGGRLKVRATRLVAPDSELVLSGEGPLAQGVALSLTGQTRLAGLAQAYVAVQAAEGVVEHDLRLTGPWSAPRMTGAFVIREASLGCFGEIFDAVAATLRLEGGALQVERAQGRVRDGSVELEGSVALQGLRIGAVALQVRAGDFAVEPAPEARARLRLDARLEAAPGGALPRLSGTLLVLDGAYRHALPLQALPALLAQGVGASRANPRRAGLALDLSVAFEPAIRLRNNLADATLSVHPGQGLRLIGTDAEPRLRGRVQLDGRLRFQSNEFRLDQAGFVFDPDLGLWPRTDLSAATARGVRLQLSGPPSDLSLSVRCESAPGSERPFECRVRGADARCDRFEELVARFRCAADGTRVD